MTQRLLKLAPVIDELIELAVAKGMSRRKAKRYVANIAEKMWKDGKLEIYGRKNGQGPLELIPPDPDLELVQEPTEH